MIKNIILTVLCLAMQAGIAQDMVSTRNGQHFAGKILDEHKKEITLYIPDQDQTVVIPRSQISSFGYDHTPDFKGSISLELFLGGTIISPTHSIKNILDQNGYGQDMSRGIFSNLEFFGNSYRYPQIKNLPVLGLSFHYAHHTRSELGLAFSFRVANLEGRSIQKGNIDVGYGNYQFTPVYRCYSRYHRSYFEAGLSLNIFQLHQNGLMDHKRQLTTLKPGIKVGSGVHFSNKQVAGLQLKMNLHFSFSKVETDALIEKTQDQSFTIPSLFKGKTIPLYMLEIGIVWSSRSRTAD